MVQATEGSWGGGDGTPGGAPAPPHRPDGKHRRGPPVLAPATWQERSAGDKIEGAVGGGYPGALAGAPPSAAPPQRGVRAGWKGRIPAPLSSVVAPQGTVEKVEG